MITQSGPGTIAELPGPPDATLPNDVAVELAADVRRSRDGRLMRGGPPTPRHPACPSA
jgi:hypothetical protein